MTLLNEDELELKLSMLERSIREWTERVAELGAEHDVLSARFKRASIMRDSLQQQWEDTLVEKQGVTT